ncbi:hypothetical protein [Zestomonas thermotolerans]|nr:hypothetical protein [Pseudomonas thermotolerans]
MPWTLARDFAEACARIRRDKLLEAAVAARAAQAEGKDWARWVKEIER